jgi:hypothetical protein
MDLSKAVYNNTRNTLDVHGNVYTVKKQRGRYYIHANNKQITITDIVVKAKNEPDLSTVEGWQTLYERNILNLPLKQVRPNPPVKPF